MPYLKVTNLYDDVYCILAFYFLHDATKNKCNYQEALNTIKIFLNKRFKVTLTPKVIVERTIKGISFCDVESREALAMITELPVHATVNVVKLFVQIFLIFQTTLLLMSGILTWLYKKLRT